MIIVKVHHWAIKQIYGNMTFYLHSPVASISAFVNLLQRYAAQLQDKGTIPDLHPLESIIEDTNNGVLTEAINIYEQM